MPDPRDQDRIYYPHQTLLWSAWMMFLLGLRSRRQFRFESRTGPFVANLNCLSSSNVQTAPHDDTIAYYLQRIDPRHLEGLAAGIVRRLIRMKALDRWRVSPENHTEHRDEKVRQRFRWVNDLNHAGRRLHAFECREDSLNRRRYFAWLTDLAVGCQSLITLANQGGRCLWKIENEGFNTQKNHGYELEHAYGEHPWAAKNFYFLLQAAHAINQLIIKGSLIGDFKKTPGSVRNFLKRLAEAFRNTLIDPELLDPDTPHAIQIRLDSS